MSLTIAYRPGTDGTPTDFTSPYGGAMNTSATISGTTLNVLFQPLAIPSSTDTNYYTIFYLSLESANTLTSTRLGNLSGAILNTSAGIASAASTLSSDTGSVIVTGKISGVWAQDTITLNGTTTAYGTKTFDINSVVRWEYVSSSAAAIPNGNVACFINSVQCALLYGSVSNAQGTRMCSYEFQFALATAKNTAISGTNVLHAPGTDGDTSSIGSFYNATVWAGADASIAIPTGGMVETDYIGVCIQFTDYANIYPCYGGGKQGTVCAILTNWT